MQIHRYIFTYFGAKYDDYCSHTYVLQARMYIFTFTYVCMYVFAEPPRVGGTVAVLCAGTSDFAVAEEAAVLLELSGVAQVCTMYVCVYVCSLSMISFCNNIHELFSGMYCQCVCLH